MHIERKRILLDTTCALILTAATVVHSPQASAQYLPSYYLPGYGHAYAPRYIPRRAASSTPKHKPAHKLAERPSRLPFGDIPKGPLEIFVSVSQQRLHFYSDGVHVADAPVATGVSGHLTPLGVFSVIQRDRYHRSNIYSDAPMPYMERITWSGVALHEGVGLGHPASHGCIRMPHDFAARLWMLHTMGMRVIIAGPELRPLPFADSHLFVRKQAPSRPITAPPATLAAVQHSSPGLRTDIIGDPPLGLTPGAAPPASTQANPQDAPTSAAPTASPAPAAIRSPDATAAAGTAGKGAPSAPVESSPATPPTAAHAADSAAPQPTAPVAGDGHSNQAAPWLAPADNATAAAASVPPAAGGVAVADSDGDIPLPPFRPAQMADGNGPIAIFISRKTSKIYVRQNFTPVFDAPVKIANPEQPIGTHVFTAMDYLPDHSTFGWTVVSLPGAQPKQVAQLKYERDVYGRIRRVRAVNRSAEPPAPVETPQDALARIEIPQDAIDQISQLIVPGSSLIISDQGLGPETGEGTDFIVVAR